MKKSVKCAVTAALLLLLCAVGIYGIFFAPRKIGCAVDDSFSWKAYSYTPVTSKTIYNYAFPVRRNYTFCGKSGDDRAAACRQ